jgi:hypothetical protein
MFGYATVYIDSANEESQLKQMTNLRHPKAFFEVLSRMVQARFTDTDTPPGLGHHVPIQPFGPVPAAAVTPVVLPDDSEVD